MIHSRSNDALKVVFNESDGPVSTDDVVRAHIRAEELGHGECAVIWDLRKSGAISVDQEMLETLGSLLGSEAITPSPHARAIVVSDEASADSARLMIESLPVPWNWIVLTDLAEAVAWVGRHHSGLR